MKNNWIVFSIAATLLLGLFFLITREQNQALQAVAFNQKIDTVAENTLTTEMLIEYENIIREEMSLIRNRRGLQQAYYSLGFINQKQENFNEAQAYLLKSANFKGFVSEDERGMLYRELAINHLALNQMEEAYDYFFRALAKSSSEPIRASLYRRFSRALLTHTDDVGLAMNLLKRGTQLNQKPLHLIEIYIQIADIYLAAGLYDFVYNYLDMALDLSAFYGYSDHEQKVISKLMTINYLLENHELVISLYEGSLDFNFGEESLISLTQVINSYQWVYGQESAQEKLDYYYPQINSDLEKDWFLMMNAQIKANAKQYEEVLMALQENQLLSDDLAIKHWFEKLRLDSGVALGEIINFEENYQNFLKEIKIMNQNNDVTAMMMENILDDLLEHGAYDLAYQITMERLSLFNSDTGFLTNNFLQRIHYYPLVRDNSSYMVVFTAVILAILGCLTFSYTRYIRKLHLTIDNQRKIDVLTRTLTHESLYSELETNIDVNQLVTFILIEIDNLEEYSKTFGYLAGDSVVKQVGNVLSDIFPHSYVSRHDGNQFLVATYNSEERINTQIELVQKSLENLEGISPYVNERNKPNVSIGISSGNLKSILDIDSCIKKAHEGLKASKIKGKGIVID